ncbi:recombinase family protein [Synechococcus sp. MIT S9508]|uniref:recombinase family protein n=1 Tax=Synechococcus sp. MIT S9508 TaxID=1801629 RepID=UPI0018D42B87
MFKSTELTTPKGQFLHSLEVSPAFLSQTKHFFIAGRNNIIWLRPLLNHQTGPEAQLEAHSRQGCDAIFSEYISGAAPYSERVKLQNAIAACSQGDLLVVANLYRLGCSMESCVIRLSELLDAGIHNKTLDDRVDTKGLGKMAKLLCDRWQGWLKRRFPGMQFYGF